MGQSGREEVSGHRPASKAASMVPNIRYRQLAAGEKQHRANDSYSQTFWGERGDASHLPKTLPERTAQQIALVSQQQKQGYVSDPTPDPEARCNSFSSRHARTPTSLAKASRTQQGAARWLPWSACSPSPRTRGQYNLPGPPARCPQTEVCPRSQGTICEYSLRPKLVATC